MIHLVLAVVVFAQADASRIEQAFHQGGTKEVVATSKSIEKQDGSAKAVQELSQALTSNHVKLRAAAAHALISMGEPAKSALPELAIALGDANEAAETVAELKALGSGDIQMWFAEAILRNEYPLDSNAYQALNYRMKADDPRIVPILIKGINHPHATVRWHSVVILEEMGSLAAPAHPHLVRLLKSTPKPAPPSGFSDNDVRARAAIALGSIAAEPKETMALLISLIKDPDAEVRKNAVLGLGWMGDKANDAIPTLIAIIDDEDLVMAPSICANTAHPKHAATTALVGIGLASIPDLTKALESKQSVVRLRSAEALLYFGDKAKSASNALIRRVRDVNEHCNVRCQSLYVLAFMDLDPKRFEQELIPLTGDKDPVIRADAAMRLGYLGLKHEIALDPLMSLIGDLNPEVRKASLRALQLAAPPEVLQSAIDQLLKDQDETVREAAQELKD
jgi:HEAT repeat protein